MTLIILAGIVLGVGVMFFKVIQPFIFPLFFGGILAILFRPVYVRAVRICRGHHRIAAALVTVGVICVVMLPLGGMLTLAGWQLVDTGKEWVNKIKLPDNAKEAETLLEPLTDTPLAPVAEWAQLRLTPENMKSLREFSSQALLGVTGTLYQRTSSLAGGVFGFVLGLVILWLSLYYFFADGEQLLKTIQELSPLEDAEERELFSQFERVCRGVVMGTVVAGLMQGILAGIGFAFLGVERVWLLMAFTALFSLIPFLGAASVWIVVALGLILEGQYSSAGILVVYGSIVVSGSDNLIRAYVIHDRAQMHPLIALVTALGALQLVGLWGIFVGPITAAFFYAILKTFRQRLKNVDEPQNPN